MELAQHRLEQRCVVAAAGFEQEFRGRGAVVLDGRRPGEGLVVYVGGFGGAEGVGGRGWGSGEEGAGGPRRPWSVVGLDVAVGWGWDVAVRWAGRGTAVVRCGIRLEWSPASGLRYPSTVDVCVIERRRGSERSLAVEEV